jgi:hypothetical protein
MVMASVLVVSLPANLVLLSRSRRLETAEAGAGVALERRLSPSSSGLPGCRQAAARLHTRIEALARELAIADAKATRGPDGRALLDGALAAFRTSGAIEKCQPSPELEPLVVRLDLPEEGDQEDGARAIVVRIGGATAAAPFGACVAEALRKSMAGVALPPHASSATVFATVPDPAPAPPPARPRQKTPGRAYD